MYQLGLSVLAHNRTTKEQQSSPNSLSNLLRGKDNVLVFVVAYMIYICLSVDLVHLAETG